MAPHKRGMKTRGLVHVGRKRREPPLPQQLGVWLKYIFVVLRSSQLWPMPSMSRGVINCAKRVRTRGTDMGKSRGAAGVAIWP